MSNALLSVETEHVIGIQKYLNYSPRVNDYTVQLLFFNNIHDMENIS